MGTEEQTLSIIVRARDFASKTIAKVDKSVDRLGKHTSRGVANAATNLTRLAGIGVVAGAALGVAALKFATDWEDAAADVRKTVDGDVEGILEGIQEMSRHMPVAATELAGIAAAAGALGVRKADILDFTRSVALLSVAADDVSFDEGATSLGHLKTTLGLAGEDFSRFVNTVTALGNQGSTTEGQVLAMTEQVAGAAKLVRLSKAETLGWSAALANTGEAVEAGGSSLQKFFLQSFKAVNKGGKGLATYARVAGMSGKAFKRAMATDFSGAMETFMVGLGRLDSASQLDVLEDLGFTDIRIQRALLKLAGNTDNLTSSLKLGRQAWHDNNAASVEAEKKFATFNNRLATFKNNMQSLAVTVGTALLPHLTKLITKVNTWLASPAVQEGIKTFAADLSSGFADLVGKAEQFAETIDWAALVTNLQSAVTLTGQVVGTALDMFNSAPDWIKTAVITGWGLNKLTGGAFGSIVGELAKGVVKGVLGITAGVVNLTASSISGGLGGATAGAGARGSSVAGAVLGVAGLAIAATAVYLTADQVMQQVKGAQQTVDRQIERFEGSGARRSADAITKIVGDLRKPRETGNLIFDFVGQVVENTGARGQANDAIVTAARNILNDTTATREDLQAGLAAIDEAQAFAAKHGLLDSETLTRLAGIEAGVLAKLETNNRGIFAIAPAVRGVVGAIAAKDWSVTTNVTVPVTTTVSGRDVAGRIVRTSIRTGGGATAE